MKTTVIVKKVVGMDCNLRCGYCYYESRTRQNDVVVMSLSLVEKMLTVVAVAGSVPTASVVWHGGEPTLTGVAYYKEVLEIQRSVTKKTGVRFGNRLQTNGIGLDGQWVDFLSQNKFKVGLSLDGPREIHDRYRIYPDGSGSFNHVKQAAELLKASNLRFGCLAVLTDASVGEAREMFEFFVSNGITRFRVKPCYEIDPDTGLALPHSISPKDYGQFLVDLFDIWIEHDDPRISCGPVDEFLRGVLGKKTSICTFAGQCQKYWSVWPSGDAYQCEFGHMPEAYLGNLWHNGGEAIVQNQTASGFVNQMNVQRVECASCRWQSACRGGCARYRLGLGRSTNLYCSARRRVYEHIANYLGK